METQAEKMLRVISEGRGGGSKNAKDIKNINRKVGESFSACICRKSSSLKVTTARLDVRAPISSPGSQGAAGVLFFSFNEFLLFLQQCGYEPARAGPASLETLGTYSITEGGSIIHAGKGAAALK